ncbi:MAG TPA: ABC transporter substrate-binding protein [Pseudonocardia sp.]|jgi:osmoprotectant transport system substrate-binding protein|nr:ABC transporter substrate-binding protein [Pseudonocardia sp.]
MRTTLIGRAAAAAVATLAVVTVSACGGGGSGGPLGGGAGSAPAAPGDTIRVGSANFPESTLIAEIYAQALEAKGVKVDRRLNLGSRETYFPGLKDGSIDLIPEYTGTVLQYLDKQATATAPDEVYSALQKTIQAPLTVLDKAPAEDKDAVVVTRAVAQRYNAKTLADLAPHCGELVFGGPPEFQQRPDGTPGIQKTYGCSFQSYRSLDVGGPLTIKALTDGTVQAADVFTTDPNIADKDLVALEDPKNNFAAQNVVPVINSAKANDQVKQILNGVSAKLTTSGLVDLNRKLNAPDKPNAAVVAKEWLAANGLG